jgi:hypothetical protein
VAWRLQVCGEVRPERRSDASLALAATLVLGLTSSTPSLAQPGKADRGTSALVGAWRMTSLEVGAEGDLEPVPYSGQIIFTRSGTVSVQAMNPGPDAPDTPYTVDG